MTMSKQPNDTAVENDIEDRVADHAQSILDLEAKTETGVEFMTGRRMEKYKHSLQHLIPVRRAASFQHKYDFPLSRAGCLSIISYSWLTPWLWQIFRHGVDTISVLKVDYEDSAEFNARRLDRLWEEELKRRGPKDASFARVCLRAVRTRLCFGLVIMFIFVCASLANPVFFVRYFLLYLSSGNIRVDYGMAFVMGLVLCECCRSASIGTFWVIYHQMGIRLRAGSATFLFKKILHLKGLKDKTVGELVNLIANDNQRIFEAAAICPLLIGGPVLMLGSVIYSVFLLGPWGLIGCIIFIGFYPFSALVSRLTSVFRRRTITVTDKRVRMMMELLSCIKLIKMYAWEKPFAKTIAEMRAQERTMLEKGAYLQSLSMAMSTMVPVFASVFTFVVYILSGNDLTAAEAFTYITLLNSMRFSLGVIPYGIKALAEASVAVIRYKSILMMEEISPPKGEITDLRDKICIKNATLCWESKREVETKDTKATTTTCKVHKHRHKTNEDVKLMKPDADVSLEPCLHSVDFLLKEGQMVGICGSVGCGKSSLISAILGRMKLVSGSVGVSGSIAYVPQQAWIMNTTVRNNILLGLPYDEERYKMVIEACALTDDFKLLVNGDETEIGERGINLSGGQKQRISLARAVYSNNDIYLLDDPLSAVDVHIGHHIAKHCLLKVLKGRTVLFVTHQLQYLVHCDEIVFMKEGCIVERGSHVTLMDRDGEYASLMKMYYREHTQEVDHEEEEEQIEPRARVSSLSASEQFGSPPMTLSNGSSATNQIDLVLLRTTMGSPPKQLDSGLPRSPVGSPPKQLDSGLPRSSLYSPKEKMLQRMFPHSAVMEVQRQYSSISSTLSASSSEVTAEGKLITTEERDQGEVSWQVYCRYMKAAGGYIVCMLVLSVFFITVTTQGGATWFLSYWLNQGSLNTTVTIGNKSMISESIMDHPHRDLYILIYGLFTVAMISIVAVRSYIFMKVTLKASSGIHDTVFAKILQSPMSFFDTTPVGRIVNRFSADLDEIDVRLPMNAEVFLNNVMLVVFSLVMISYVSSWFLVALLPFGTFFFFLFTMFLRCVRELKRQDAITKSPIISHVTASVQGIATIYSYGKVQQFIDRFSQLMDINTIPFFIYYTSNRWLALRLDMICIMVTATTGTIIVLTYDQLSPALAGLALSFAIQMAGLFQFTVRLAVETESRFTCVQRIQQYAENVAEGENSATAPVPDDWPSKGKVVFSKVKMRYRDGQPLALKGVTFDINSCEKIGIVGRSGSGKSSLGVTLFRLVDPVSGFITIDDVDISRVALYDLRSKLSIIPQDPVLFVGSIRYNLDPFGQHQDEELWAALEKCHVKDMICGLDEQLSAPVIENGENFSVGERQLLCLARALLRYSKILVLDEATAAIDTETDTLVQMTIKEAFSQCTMLIIAHRLNTVLTCDRILVMEGGKVVEYDKPSVLMSKTGSKFKSMLEALDNQDMT